MTHGAAAPATLQALRAMAAQLAAGAELDLVVLFGSTATGARAQPEDVDIAVRAPGRTVDLVALTNRAIALLGRQDVDLVDLRRADPLLLALVARDGLVLFERTPATFTAFVSLAVRRFADTRKFREAERDAIRDEVRRHGSGT